MQPYSQGGVRYVPTEARRSSAVAMVALVVAGVVQILAGVVTGGLTSSSGPMIMYGTCGLLFIASGIYSWQIVSRGYTELTGTGLVVRTVRVRTVEWRGITDIQPIRRGRFQRVRVRRASGRDLILIAPLTRASRPNPRFAAELETMRTWWWQNRHR